MIEKCHPAHSPCPFIPFPNLPIQKIQVPISKMMIARIYTIGSMPDSVGDGK
jgi:hypothetical protein